MKNINIPMFAIVIIVLLSLYSMYSIGRLDGRKDRPSVYYLRNESGSQTELYSALKLIGIEMNDAQKEELEDNIRNNTGRKHKIGF